MNALDIGVTGGAHDGDELLFSRGKIAIADMAVSQRLRRFPVTSSSKLHL
jgi:hypothetical protein